MGCRYSKITQKSAFIRGWISHQVEVRYLSVWLFRVCTSSILTKKGTYMSPYLCKHVGIQVNLSLVRIPVLLSMILGYNYQALTRLRYLRFENRLDDKPLVGTRFTWFDSLAQDLNTTWVLFSFPKCIRLIIDNLLCRTHVSKSFLK